jgi:hypothetical protein
VLAKQEQLVRANPGVATVFDCLERHWPKLVTAIENRRIPLTNNATELVNRRFDQPSQNFGGFRTIETAQTSLAVFARAYRLTPFTMDAQAQVRGKGLLELAGYDGEKIPLAQLCSGEVGVPLKSPPVPGRCEPARSTGAVRGKRSPNRGTLPESMH